MELKVAIHIFTRFQLTSVLRWSLLMTIIAVIPLIYQSAKMGRLKMSIQMKDSICQGNSDELTIDTTGTGTLVYADKAYIEVAETVNGNTTKSRYAGTAMKFTPASDASYSISFVYRENEGVDEQRISMTKR